MGQISEYLRVNPDPELLQGFGIAAALQFLVTHCCHDQQTGMAGLANLLLVHFVSFSNSIRCATLEFASMIVVRCNCSTGSVKIVPSVGFW